MQGRCHQSFQCVNAAVATAEDNVTKADSSGAPAQLSETRVRFAPSPTGYLHVGGARTALFNYLYAKHTGGKFILRVEDTDQARSTAASEAVVLQDLQWMGLQWDEGPDIGGAYGPYRQSERRDIYKQYVDQLVNEGQAYPCFCTDEELAAMKKEAEEAHLPPIYRGKWAQASQQEVDEELAKGTPHCYRFRVPPNQDVTIKDGIRGEVTWNTNTLGDFVVLRSNGLPVYNFCVAIDDALMRISHVIRAEEHLPNTLRQVLIYDALGFAQPAFSHVSLILAPDKSKLSKRHGATSVGEFREEGYLSAAMVNYLSLLGWNDGTEQEFFSLQELQDKFTLDRVNKSAAVFDKTKLSWMNGQHLRELPDDKVEPLVAQCWQQSGLLHHLASPFVKFAVAVLKPSLELVVDAERDLRHILAYPLMDTLQGAKAEPVLGDNFKEVVDAALAAYDSGKLAEAVKDGPEGYKQWIKGVGKEMGRKGKRLFMPMRIAFTGSQEGPEVGEVLHLLSIEDGDVKDINAYVPLTKRMDTLREWSARQP
eukprot:jgi/Astpho2/8916/Aster-02603